MTDALRGPYVRIKASMPRHRKLAGLPNDGARWAFVALLCEAKVQSPPGEWASERHLRACVTPSVARQLSALVDATLIDQDEGRFRIHDWPSYQIDPTGTERSRLSRSRNEDATETQRTGNTPATPRAGVHAFASLSPSLEEGGSGGDDPLDQAEQWLASRNTSVQPGSKGEVELSRLCDQHGATAVIAAMDSLGPQNDGRQYVFGAMKVLNPIPNPKRDNGRFMGPSQEDIDNAFR